MIDALLAPSAILKLCEFGGVDDETQRVLAGMPLRAGGFFVLTEDLDSFGHEPNLEHTTCAKTT